MEQSVKARILNQIRPEVFEYTPFNCPGHRLEHIGWDFANERCSSIKTVARCIYCGKLVYGYKTRNAVGPNSFDLQDERLIKSGILGDHYLSWVLKHQHNLGQI